MSLCEFCGLEHSTNASQRYLFILLGKSFIRQKNKAEVLLLDFSLFYYFIAIDKTLVMWLKCVF